MVRGLLTSTWEHAAATRREDQKKTWGPGRLGRDIEVNQAARRVDRTAIRDAERTHAQDAQERLKRVESDRSGPSIPP